MTKNESSKPKALTCVESFCGPGGMGFGLRQAGYDIKFAFDIDGPSVSTYNRNVGDHAVVADAKAITPEEVLRRIGMGTGDVDLWAGGPPCQGFSKQKRGAHLGDDRNDLVSRYIELVNGVRPRAFILENVAVFGQKRGSKYIEEMGEVLHEYEISSHFYNCADYGIAQTRQRFVAVGVRRDLDVRFNPPKPTTSKWATVGSVLQGVPEPPLDYSTHPEYPNHQLARVTRVNVERFSHVPQGGGWKDIPFDLRPPRHQRMDPSSGGWPDVYGRLCWDGQCPTITGGFDSFTRGRYGHPLRDRPITPYEAARLQGFPHGYEFTGNREDVRSQIGNAVPPPLAKAIGSRLRDLLLWRSGP